MSDTMSVDLIVRAIAEGFQKLEKNLEGQTDAAEDLEKSLKETSKAAEKLGAASDGAEKKGKTFTAALREGKQVMGAMNMVMGLGKAALDEVAASADRLGRTELGDNMDAVGESIEDLKDNLLTLEVGGRDAIAWISDAAGGLNNLVKVVGVAGIAWAQHTGAISDNEAAIRAAALANGDYVLSEEQLAQAKKDAADPRDESNRLTNAYTAEVKEAAKAAYDLAKAEEAAKAAADLSNDVYATGLGIIGASNLAESEKLRIQIALKMASGELTIEELARQQAVSNLTQAFIDGKISEQEYIDGMAELARQGELTSISLGNVLLGLNALPDTKTITINTVENGNYGNVVEPTGTNPYADYGPGGGTTSSGNGYATGVYGMVVPPGYPNDTYPMRVQSGEVVDVWKSPAERARAMGGGGDNVTNNFYDHRATAMYLADQRRKKRARADALMGA